MTHWDTLHIFLSAVLASLTPGGVAPSMTTAISGPSTYPPNFLFSAPTHQDKNQLFSGVGLSSLKLTGLAIDTPLLNSVAPSLWIAIGGRVCRGWVDWDVSNSSEAWFRFELVRPYLKDTETTRRSPPLANHISCDPRLYSSKSHHSHAHLTPSTNRSYRVFDFQRCRSRCIWFDSVLVPSP